MQTDDRQRKSESEAIDKLNNELIVLPKIEPESKRKPEPKPEKANSNEEMTLSQKSLFIFGMTYIALTLVYLPRIKNQLTGFDFLVFGGFVMTVASMVVFLPFGTKSK